MCVQSNKWDIIPERNATTRYKICKTIVISHLIVIHKTTNPHTVWKTRNSANLVFSLTFFSLKFMSKPQNLVKINLFLQPEWFWQHKFCIKLALARFQPSETNKVAPETNFPCWRFLYVRQIYNRLEYFWQSYFNLYEYF